MIIYTLSLSSAKFAPIDEERKESLSERGREGCFFLSLARDSLEQAGCARNFRRFSACAICISGGQFYVFQIFRLLDCLKQVWEDGSRLSETGTARTKETKEGGRGPQKCWLLDDGSLAEE